MRGAIDGSLYRAAQAVPRTARGTLLKRYVVIDKSYLRAASPAKVQELCANGALMTDSLFAELLTTDAESRRECFARLPRTPNPIELIPGIGDLMRFEASNHRSCTPLQERRIAARFQFHPGLAEGTYQFCESELDVVRDVVNETEQRVSQFAEAAAVVHFWFPELKGFPANGPPAVIESVMTSIATDPERVRSIYAVIAAGIREMIQTGALVPPPDFALPPAADAIDESWVWFRFIQVDLLAGVEFVRKHGAGMIARPKSLEHDIMDAEYVAIAALSGALASRDKRMQEFF